MDLRPYQEKAVQSIFDEWGGGNQKTLLIMATGCGKTIVFSKVAERCVREGKRVLILAHRKELLDQAADKIKQSTGLNCAVECASENSEGSWYRITVGSVQTLMRPKRLHQFSEDHFDVIIVDECHHSLSGSYQAILNYFSQAHVLGVTATADRTDKKNLGEIFDSKAFEYDMATAIRDGYLAPIVTQTIPLDIDLNSVQTKAGDFNAADIGHALDPYLDQIADEMVQYCKDRKTVVFLPLIDTSKRFCEMLKSRGFNAAEVNGGSEDRAEVLKRFDDGEINVLCNSMLLTEGWDCPSVDCIVCLRPTKSRSLYVQIVGRGTRLSTGKKNLLLLDFLWHHDKHQLCRPAHLLSKDDVIAKKMTDITQDGMAYDLQVLESEVERDVLAEREATLIEELKRQRHKKKSLVDPLQFEFSIRDNDLASYVPNFGWECNPITDKQKQALEKFGIMASENLSCGKATLLIDKLIKRSSVGLSTARQIRLLERYNFKNVGMWTKEEANSIIKRLSATNWRVPHNLRPESYQPESLRRQYGA